MKQIKFYKQHQGTYARHYSSTKLNQGFPRRLGVLSGGWPFWVPFWASKKVQKQKRSFN
jgi:hypothetical protein